MRSEQGFTIIEILLAVVVLSVGVMALVGSSALATRMIGRGNMSSRVTQVANARAELPASVRGANLPRLHQRGGRQRQRRNEWHHRSLGIGRQCGGRHPRCDHDLHLPGSGRHTERGNGDHPLLQVTMTTRRGFTLVELLIGLILMLAVGAVTYQLLVNTQRVSRSQSQHIGMQDNGRSGALIIANELRGQGYDQITAAALASIAANVLLPGNALVVGTNSDLRAIGPDSLTYRAVRGLGYACKLTPGAGAAGDVVVYDPAVALNDPRKWQAYRTLTTTDSVMLFIENDPTTSTDDIWLTAGLTAVPDAQLCADGSSGLRLRIALPGLLAINAATAFGQMPIGNPVRAFELMQLRSYSANGKTWLGMRSRPLTLGTTIEPVVGPLSGAATGLAFTYRDASNAVTTVADNVRSVEISLQPMSDEMARTTGRYAKMDSLTMTTRVALRNALRP